MWNVTSFACACVWCSGEGVEWPWLLHVREQGPTSTSTSTSSSSTEAVTYPPGSILDLKGLARRQQRGLPPNSGGTSGTQGGGHVVRLMLAWDNKKTIRPLPRAALHYLRQVRTQTPPHYTCAPSTYVSHYIHIHVPSSLLCLLSQACSAPPPPLTSPLPLLLLLRSTGSVTRQAWPPSGPSPCPCSSPPAPPLP